MAADNLDATSEAHDQTSPDTSRCDHCHGIFPSDELTEIEYCGGDGDEVLEVCEGCLFEYGQCYRCGRWFMARKLNGLSEEMLAELYDESTVAAFLEDGDVPEVVCLGCEAEFDRYGPNTAAVEQVIHLISKLNRSGIEALEVEWYEVYDAEDEAAASVERAEGAAREAAAAAGRTRALDAALEAMQETHTATENASSLSDAVLAYVCKDLISAEDCSWLTHSWRADGWELPA